MKTKNAILLIIIIGLASLTAAAQTRKEKNQPFADQKLYHLGFQIGIHGQDMILKHTGIVQQSGEQWFAELPSYSAGFSVGIIGDRYLSQYFNLRLIPTLHFGEKHYTFKEAKTGDIYKTNMRSNYLSIPLQLKMNAGRIDNYRPYLITGVYVAMDITPKKDMALRYKSIDYGLEFGLGCNFYLPLFKLCPEIKFSLGLADIINKDRSDMSDLSLMKYTEAISSGKNRMISLVFNFE